MSSSDWDRVTLLSNGWDTIFSSEKNRVCMEQARKEVATLPWRAYKGWYARVGVLLLIGVLAVLFPVVSVPLLVAYIARQVVLTYSQPRVDRNKLNVWMPPHMEHTVQEGFFTTSDGVSIRYSRTGTGSKLIMLANGWGVRMYGWQEMFARSRKYLGEQADDYTCITWHYRALFKSSAPSQQTDANLQQSSLSFSHDARDAKELMQHLGFDRVDVMVGWSMGVQVSLEFAAVFPDLVDRLVLINGTWGDIARGLFQPLGRVPVPARVVDWVMAKMIAIMHVFLVWCGAPVGRLMVKYQDVLRVWWFEVFGVMFANRAFPFYLMQYFLDITSNGTAHTEFYARVLRELCEHSVWHRLPHVKQPVLIVASMFDHFTPAYESYELHYMLPNSQLVVNMWSSHFTLMQVPESVARPVSAFLKDHPSDMSTWQPKPTCS